MKQIRQFGLALLIGLAPLGTAFAEETGGFSRDDAESDDIDATLERQRRIEDMFRTSREPPEWIRQWRSTRDGWLEGRGFDVGASYHTVGLVALGNGDPDSGFSGDLTVAGIWDLGAKRLKVPFDLRFRVRHRHAIGDVPASAVAGQTGALWGLVDGFSDKGWEIPDFQLVQKFPSRNIELRYGQMTIESQFDRHALRSSKNVFMNRAFSSNPAVAFPRFGAGVTFHRKLDSGFDYTLGVSSVQGTTSGTQVDFDFGSNDFFQAVQGGWDFEIDGDPARFQAMVWRSDAIENAGLPEGQGVSLVFERALPECDARWFARAAWAGGRATDLNYLFAVGTAVERQDNDLFGMALGIGRDSLRRDDWQGVFECFYRLQRNSVAQITPAVQVVFGEGLPGRDVRLVAGIRGSLSF